VKPWVIWVLLAMAGFMAFAIFSSMSGQKFRADVCMVFNGKKQCRTAIGATEEEAIRTATSNACALLASGMTETMSCERVPPISVATQPVR
jgi:hypothetical protein